ncbi:MAG: phage tail tape measure protein [Pseudomonadota bacterium]
MDEDTGPTRLGQSLSETAAKAGGFSGDLTRATEAMRAMDLQAARLARSIGSSLRGAFDRAVFGGAKLGDVFRGLVFDVGSRALDAALAPVQGALNAGIAGVLGSLGSALSGSFAKGGVISAGDVTPFARGGVLDRPMLFPMRSGLGLAGEAGPEAIMPLQRGPDGRLGVAAGGRGATTLNVSIATPDIEGFRRSRGQVAAELARAVARGNRRL